MLKYTRIGNSWREHHGWPVSMRSFLFIFISIIFLTRFALLFVFLGLRGLKEEKRQKEKKNIACLAFSWIEGFFLLLMVVALYPILFLFIRRIYNNLLAGFILVFIFIVSIS